EKKITGLEMLSNVLIEMKRIKLITGLVLCYTILCADAFGQNETISYKELTDRLTNLKALAVLPQQGEKSAMWSSYDRKSKVSPSGEFIEWGANNDGLSPQYIRKEGENMVLAEM